MAVMRTGACTDERADPDEHSYAQTCELTLAVHTIAMPARRMCCGLGVQASLRRQTPERLPVPGPRRRCSRVLMGIKPKNSAGRVRTCARPIIGTGTAVRGCHTPRAHARSTWQCVRYPGGA